MTDYFIFEDPSSSQTNRHVMEFRVANSCLLSFSVKLSYNPSNRIAQLTIDVFYIYMNTRNLQ